MSEHLPSDDGDIAPRLAERVVETWALDARGSFADRRAYNWEICDRLVRAGIVPVPAVVSRVGRWGHSTDVAKDVKSWLKALGQRFADSDATVPPGARKQANALVEQLWRLAQVDVDQRSVEPLRQELVAKDSLIALAAENARTLEERNAVLVSGLAQAKVELEQVAAQLTETTRSLTVERDRALVQVQELHKQERLASAARDEAAREHTAAIADLQARLAAEVDRASAERRALLTRVDSGQAEIKRWAQIAQKAQDSIKDMQDHLAQLRLDLLASQGREALANSRLQDQAASLDDLRRQLATAIEREALTSTRLHTAGETAVAAFLAQSRSFGVRIVREMPLATLKRPSWMSEGLWDCIRDNSVYGTITGLQEHKTVAS